MIFQSENKNKIKVVSVFCISLVFLTGCGLPSFGKKIVSFGCNDFSPICGEDSVTYYNECQAKEYDTKIDYDGVCNDGDITVIPYGITEDKEK